MRHRDNPYWYWWNSLQCKIEIPLEQRVRSFNPIYRISNKALFFLNSFLKDQNVGHHEVLIPTILDYYQYSIGDFGCNGEFSLFRDEESAFYLPERNSYFLYGGTMRYRPEFQHNEFIVKNKLYHPVKC